MRCDIIIPVWNQLEATRECVDSIIKHTGYPYRLIMIDNASDSPTAEYLKTLASGGSPEAKLIRNDENLGFAKAVNQGLKASDAAFVCVMNNDTVAAPGWLSEMIKIFESDPSIGIINPSSNTSGQFPEKGRTVDEFASSLKKFSGRTQELYECRGFCMLIKKEVIDKVGLFDESYKMGYFEETDYSARAHRAGFRVVRAKASYVYHKERESFKELESAGEIFDSNERLYFSRWGRPVRVAYIVRGALSADKVDAIASNIARRGHRVWVLMKKDLPWPVRTDHFNIRRLDCVSFPFLAAAFLKIMKRKRKKKFEVLVTDDAGCGVFLNATRLFHGAQVCAWPDEDRLFGILDELSRPYEERIKGDA